ncbi:hypothetical protein FACS189449_01370 [Alphaproteobacteria bacterium]|nr:hypothetical protein FACS189449_01370 [Alphaproteobacteria bacterium]
MFDHVNSDPEAQEFIRMREKGIRDYNSAVKSAERKGEMEGAKNVAKNLLNLGVDIGIISTSTGLSTDEIKLLIRQLFLELVEEKNVRPRPTFQ